MKTQPKIDIPMDRIRNFCRKWKIAEFSLFGSVLRENAGWDLFDWVDMIEELKGIFGREVDLVSKNGLRNPFRRQRILTSREVLYAA
jgi:uncharacterized protein